MAFGIILLVLAVIIMIGLFIWDSNHDGVGVAGFIGGLAFVFLYTGIDILMPDITPMDVYQGKTTLKYEVVDGEIVDSTVIWKKNIE